MSVLKRLRAAKGTDDLAALLGFKPSAVTYILYKLPDSAKYTTFKIPKKAGGEREICAPTDQLKLLQKRLANLLYKCRAEIDRESGLKSTVHMGSAKITPSSRMQSLIKVGVFVLNLGPQGLLSQHQFRARSRLFY